jgi:hypothetical protein
VPEPHRLLAVIAAKAALRNEGDLSVADQMVLRLSEPLLEAALGWLERWNGKLPKIGVCPAVGTSSQGGGDAGLSEEERYLVGLLERRPLSKRPAPATHASVVSTIASLKRSPSHKPPTIGRAMGAIVAGKGGRLRRMSPLANGRGAQRLFGRHTSKACKVQPQEWVGALGRR